LVQFPLVRNVGVGMAVDLPGSMVVGFQVMRR
jgi:hypothetical protein